MNKTLNKFTVLKNENGGQFFPCCSSVFLQWGRGHTGHRNKKQCVLNISQNTVSFHANKNITPLFTTPPTYLNN